MNRGTIIALVVCSFLPLAHAAPEPRDGVKVGQPSAMRKLVPAEGLERQAAGILEGQRNRLTGEGEAEIRGGPSGDLFVLINVKPHKLFRREGSNIYCRVPVPMTTAALGGNLDVPTIEGQKASVKIPSGTQTGQQLRMKGKGMSIMRSEQRGDMFVEIFVETPVNLDKNQTDLMKQLDESLEKAGRKHTPQSEGFFAKVKELWDDLKD